MLLNPASKKKKVNKRQRQKTAKKQPTAVKANPNTRFSGVLQSSSIFSEGKYSV